MLVMYNMQPITLKDITPEYYAAFQYMFTKNPGWITNNYYATYQLIDRDHSGGLSENDHVDIDIFGPDNGSVRVKSVEQGENFFSANFITLEGHTDAGEIKFYGNYDPVSQTMSFTITNITQTNVVGICIYI